MRRAYKYGCKVPAAADEAIVQQLRFKNDLWNQLVESDNLFRDQLDPLVQTEMDKVLHEIQLIIFDTEKSLRGLKAEAAYRTIELREAIGARREELRALSEFIKTAAASKTETAAAKRVVSFLCFDDVSEFLTVEQIKADLARWRRELTQFYASAKALRHERWKEKKEEIRALFDERKARASTIMKASGAFWCNSDATGKDYFVASAKAIADHVRLRFHSFDRHGCEGAVCTRASGGWKPEQLFGGSMKAINIEPIAESAWDRALGRKRKKQQWVRLRMLVASAVKGVPVPGQAAKNLEATIITFDACFHRKIPVDAKIDIVSLVRRRGDFHENFLGKLRERFSYDLIFTLTLPDPAPASADGTTAHVEFSSVPQDDGSIIVAQIDNGGAIETIRLEQCMTSQLERLESVSAALDIQRDQAIAAISKTRAGGGGSEWFMDATKTVERWQSPKGPAFLLEKLRENRFAGDEEIFAALTHYRERFLHLKNWTINLRDQLLLRRQHFFRNVAARLVKNCSRITLEALVRLKPAKAEEVVRIESKKRYVRRFSALYNFQQIIKCAAERAGVLCEEVAVRPRLRAIA